MKMLIRNILLGLILFGGICGCSSPAKQTSPWAHRSGPKNVIIFIADGAGFNHFLSADYYQCGLTPCQPYESFPVQLAMTTFPAAGSYDPNAARDNFNYVSSNATDSAAAATALATGVKSYNAAIGVDVHHKSLPNLLERAEQLGKSTGVVTSVPFSHATPAGFVAHNVHRDNYTQIADDMINKSAADVVMGCGNPLFDPDAKPARAANYKYVDEKVWSDLKNGSAGGDADGDGIPDHWKLIQTRAEFQNLATGPTPKRVLGIPHVFETLQEKRFGDFNAAPFKVPFTQTVPTLEEMTIAAINVLDDDPNGFFIMIEGGAADWAAHANLSGRLIEEMNDFNKSVEAVIHWVNTKSSWDETLVIITADHETGHLTGILNNGAGKLPSMEWHSKNHTNSLVSFFAKGPGSQSFKIAPTGIDPLRGPYIDNTSVANTVFSLWHTN